MQNVRVVTSLVKYFTKRYFRDKVAIFFTFIFPLVFLLVFGSIFGRDGGTSFDVAIINNSKTEFASSFVEQGKKDKVLKVKNVVSYDDAKQKLGRGELDAIIELPDTFGQTDSAGHPSGTLKTLYDKSNEQASQAFNAVMQAILDGINSGFVKVNPPFKLQAEPIQTANLTRFDYTLAGLIGFSIMSLGIFSMSEGFTGDKKDGALRRLKVAPVKAWHVIVSTALNRVFVGILVVAAMFSMALVIFDFNMRGNYLNFLAFTTVSTICMFGFGMAIAGWAKDGNQAAPISNLVSFPMMFLSGVFFPRFLMPEWLQGLTGYLPLTPIIDGFRLILTENKGLLDLGPQFAVIGAWTVVIYLIAFKTFRWE